MSGLDSNPAGRRSSSTGGYSARKPLLAFRLLAANTPLYPRFIRDGQTACRPKRGVVGGIELTSSSVPSDRGPNLQIVSGARRTWGRPVRVPGGRRPIEHLLRGSCTR